MFPATAKKHVMTVLALGSTSQLIPHSGVNELIGDAVRSYSEELELVVSQVREKWKNTRIILRGNGAFCREGLMR